jgi:hypothetical protein
MAWLMTVIDTLVDVADLPYPAIADNLSTPTFPRSTMSAKHDSR